MNTCDAIRSLRVRGRFSRREVAKRAHFSVDDLRGIETGTRRVTSVEALRISGAIKQLAKEQMRRMKALLGKER